jgi:hypothetical protein
MKATAWKGGSYGIRVGQPNAKRFFPRHWKYIEVTAGRQTCMFPLRSTFWTTCPEFRGTAIENWLNRHSLIPWPPGNPPEVTLTPLGGRRFRLTYP